LAVTPTVSSKIGLSPPESYFDLISYLNCEKPSITIPEMKERIGLTPKQTWSMIDNLKKRGIMERRGSRKSGLWIITSDNK